MSTPTQAGTNTASNPGKATGKATRAPRTRSQGPANARNAMEELAELEVAEREEGDGAKAQKLIKAIVNGRMPATTPAVVRRAVLSSIDVAFAIAREESESFSV